MGKGGRSTSTDAARARRKESQSMEVKRLLRVALVADPSVFPYASGLARKTLKPPSVDETR